MFANFQLVVIACGVNDLARYGHTPLTLGECVVPFLVSACYENSDTMFVFSSILNTRHDWLNSWICQFNGEMLDLTSCIPNFRFFDAQNVLATMPTDKVFADDIHISYHSRVVVTTALRIFLHEVMRNEKR